MVILSEYLDPQLVFFIDASSREEALKKLVDQLAQQGKVKDKELFYRAVLDREQLVSTGIGMGVAIPHAKLSLYNHFFIAIGILKQGIPWDALDGAPVRLIFMIGGPDDKQTEYLQLLSSLTYAIKEEHGRKKMLQLTNPEEIIQLFNP